MWSLGLSPDSALAAATAAAHVAHPCQMRWGRGDERQKVLLDLGPWQPEDQALEDNQPSQIVAVCLWHRAADATGHLPPRSAALNQPQRRLLAHGPQPRRSDTRVSLSVTWTTYRP